MPSPMTLQHYVDAVTELVASDLPVDSLVAAIRPLKARLLQQDDLIPSTFFEGLDGVAYTRNLLYQDSRERFTVMACVWAPGRMTPPHDHLTWGVVGAYGSGIRAVTYSAPDPNDGHLEPTGDHHFEPGDVITIVPPRELNIHAMGNIRDEPTVSIHTYGDPARRCRTYDITTGRTDDRDLSFHHVLC